MCRSDMLLKDPKHRAHIIHGNSFSGDGHAGQEFDYLLANPPFGVEWKKVKKPVEDERDEAALPAGSGRDYHALTTGLSSFCST